MSEALAYVRQGSLGLIRLNRPDALNALTPEMIAGLEAAARAAEADPQVFALCITGEGRGFCAGIDMGMLQDSAASDSRALAHPNQQPLFSFLLNITKPVIAAVNGVAAGGGFVLACASDLRFVAESGNFQTIFARRGLIAEHGMSWLLPRLVGTSRALDMLWSSRRIDAQEALRIGLADRVAPDAALIESVQAYFEDMARSVSPTAVAYMKHQIYQAWEATFTGAADYGKTLMSLTLSHPDATEGAMSFVGRRAPRFAPWTGGGR